MEKISQIATPVIAVLIVAGVIVLVALGHNIPNELWAGMTLILGFFFGKQ